MLPYLARKPIAGVIIQQRKADGGKTDQLPEDQGNHAMEAAAEDILRAISTKDAKHLALALQAAYDICDSSEESSEDKPSPHSYEAQNQAAGQEQE